MGTPLRRPLSRTHSTRTARAVRTNGEIRDYCITGYLPCICDTSENVVIR